MYLPIDHKRASVENNPAFSGETGNMHIHEGLWERVTCTSMRACERGTVGRSDDVVFIHAFQWGGDGTTLFLCVLECCGEFKHFVTSRRIWVWRKYLMAHCTCIFQLHMGLRRIHFLCHLIKPGAPQILSWFSPAHTGLCRLVPRRLVPRRLVPRRLVPCRLVPRRLVPRRLVPRT